MVQGNGKAGKAAAQLRGLMGCEKALSSAVVGQSEQGSRPEMQSILDGLEMPVAVVDARANVVIANAAWRSNARRCPLCSCEVGECYAEHLERDVGHAAAAEVRRSVRSVLGPSKGDAAAPPPIEHACSDGTTVITHVVPLAGEPRRVLLVHEDVTVARVAERAIVEARLDHERLELAIEATNDGVFDWNIETGAVNGSRRLYEMLGYEPGEIAPHVSAWEELTHPDDVGGARRAISEHIKGRTAAYRSELRLRAKSGEWVWVVDRGKVVERDAGGRALRMSGTHTDISERKRMELRLLVSDRMATLGTLSACVAHEINAPLASALGCLDVAASEIDPKRGRPVDEARLADAIAVAREALLRVQEIARDLHSLSRVEQEDKAPPVDVRDVLEGALRLARREIEQRATLERFFDDVPPVAADPARLGQVFLNLLVNAAHAIAPGAPQDNQIEVSTSTSADRVIVDISDTGQGMDAAVRARVFEPFFTTKPSGAGIGLGLSICQSIVTALGGDISVESAPGFGTRFRVSLPALPRASVQSETTSNGAGKAAPAARRRILVVDDEPGMCLSLRLLLGVSSEVVTATCAAAALRAIAAGPEFDVILCDLMMPGGSGQDLHRQLSLEHPAQARAMVFMTGGVLSAETQAFLDEIPNPVLFKPFEVERLEAVLLSSRA